MFKNRSRLGYIWRLGWAPWEESKSSPNQTWLPRHMAQFAKITCLEMWTCVSAFSKSTPKYNGRHGVHFLVYSSFFKLKQRIFAFKFFLPMRILHHAMLTTTLQCFTVSPSACLIGLENICSADPSMSMMVIGHTLLYWDKDGAVWCMMFIDLHRWWWLMYNGIEIPGIQSSVRTEYFLRIIKQ